MSTYVSPQDRTGRRISQGDMARYFPGRGVPIVGQVIAVLRSEIVLRYPITEEAVLDENGAPTGRYKALEEARYAEVRLPPGEVELWG